jgi:hypothetical protein
MECNVAAILNTHHKTKQCEQAKPTTGLLYAHYESLKNSIAHFLLNARKREIGEMALVFNLESTMDPKTLDNLERFVYKQCELSSLRRQARLGKPHVTWY